MSKSTLSFSVSEYLYYSIAGHTPCKWPGFPGVLSQLYKALQLLSESVTEDSLVFRYGFFWDHKWPHVEMSISYSLPITGTHCLTRSPSKGSSQGYLACLQERLQNERRWCSTSLWAFPGCWLDGLPKTSQVRLTGTSPFTIWHCLLFVGCDGTIPPENCTDTSLLSAAKHIILTAKWMSMYPAQQPGLTSTAFPFQIVKWISALVYDTSNHTSFLPSGLLLFSSCYAPLPIHISVQWSTPK